MTYKHQKDPERMIEAYEIIVDGRDTQADADAIMMTLAGLVVTVLMAISPNPGIAIDRFQNGLAVDVDNFMAFVEGRPKRMDS